ncbi:MAG: cytochrome ubiquinol oxidase subunit I [Acidobacteria bacterium]|nr:MAG: cytochrome ubiquinol oxidase subunit I [Acidobacteriota bacterium]
MDHLMLARSLMTFSLAFHIIFASISMVMPFLMTWSYWNYQKNGSEIDLKLTKAWMRGSAILFATGAVSGTVLSFQLGLLWPTFMEHAGPIFGMPFSLEGAAFFLEAIFLGLFLYGWGRIPARLHLIFGLLVGLCGLVSGILVIAANGWMNAPAGFDWVNGQAINIDPVKAMFNEAWPLQAIHMLVAAFQATTLAAAGLHAYGLLKKKSPQFHKRALLYLMPIFAVASLIQPLIGDFSAKSVAKRQPEKLAAMEALFETQEKAPLLLGGWPNEETQEVHGAIELPGMLSFLAFADFNAEVKGLDAFPKENWPPVLPTHVAFQIMVGLGTLFAIMSLWILWRIYKKKSLDPPWFLKALLVLSPTGFLALETGWAVTEVGRQPWIIYQVMRTKDAVTPVTGLEWSLVILVLIYFVLAFVSFKLLFKWFEVASREES